MSTMTLAVGQPTLADRLFSRSLTTDLILIGAGAAFTGLLAQVTIPLDPVPITGQTLAVLLTGSALGSLRGALSLLLYAILGTIGLPWFSDGTSGTTVLFGPTGGYIIGFIFAAALTGWLAQREWDHRVVGAFLSFAAGTITIFALGMPWLAVVKSFSFEQTLQYGLYPFIVGGIIKAILAAGIIPLAWKASAFRRSTKS